MRADVVMLLTLSALKLKYFLKYGEKGRGRMCAYVCESMCQTALSCLFVLTAPAPPGFSRAVGMETCHECQKLPHISPSKGGCLPLSVSVGEAG